MTSTKDIRLKNKIVGFSGENSSSFLKTADKTKSQNKIKRRRKTEVHNHPCSLTSGEKKAKEVPQRKELRKANFMPGSTKINLASLINSLIFVEARIAPKITKNTPNI